MTSFELVFGCQATIEDLIRQARALRRECDREGLSSRDLDPVCVDSAMDHLAATPHQIGATHPAVGSVADVAYRLGRSDWRSFPGGRPTRRPEELIGPDSQRWPGGPLVSPESYWVRSDGVLMVHR